MLTPRPSYKADGLLIDEPQSHMTITHSYITYIQYSDRILIVY